MTPEQLEKLRRAFPPEAVGKLPRVTCKDCSKGNGTCQQHQRKQKCRECNAFVSPAHIHLDFVGHAETTDRLISVDPEWQWEPFGLDERGLPALILDSSGQPIGLWIKLTIAGVTRPGYGSIEKPKPDGVKELIGDAIRNAAMRFGVALDLWAKGELESAVIDEPRAGTSTNVPSASPTPQESAPPPVDAPPQVAVEDGGSQPGPSSSGGSDPAPYLSVIYQAVGEKWPDSTGKPLNEGRILFKVNALAREMDKPIVTDFDHIDTADIEVLRRTCEAIGLETQGALL